MNHEIKNDANSKLKAIMMLSEIRKMLIKHKMIKETDKLNISPEDLINKLKFMKAKWK